MYYSHKEYGHERGLSCCFRQHRADSHCKLLHGYALSVKLEFRALVLDERNWVVDFGALKPVELFLKEHFDHTLLVAYDDPQKDEFLMLSAMKLADVRILDNVGCEAFAEFIFNWVTLWVQKTYGSRVQLHHVTVKEHGANGASYGN